MSLMMPPRHEPRIDPAAAMALLLGFVTIGLAVWLSYWGVA
jgi:hypothetical protein